MMLDNLVHGLHQIGAALADRSQHDLLALVETEAQRARSLLDAIIADLQPDRREEIVLDGRLQRLMEMAGPALARDLVERLGIDLATVETALRAAGPMRDWAELRTQSHILIALAGAAGARQLQTAAEQLNRLAQGSDAAALDQILPPCLTLTAALREAIGILLLPAAESSAR